jgi:hypothetical protein
MSSQKGEKGDRLLFEAIVFILVYSCQKSSLSPFSQDG